MTDRTDTRADEPSSAADERIDALARDAGRELRRPPGAGTLAGIHRRKRNRQIARATGGGLAVLAVGGVLFVAIDRSGDERLVPATVAPTVTPNVTPTVVQTSPVTSGVTTPAADVATTVSPPGETVATVDTTPTPTTPALGSFPAELYLASFTDGQVQRVVDVETGDVLRTEPLDDARHLQAWPELTQRTSSARLGITYGLVVPRGDGGLEDFTVGDKCGQYELSVEGAAIGSVALPPRASFVGLSADGRRVVTVSTPTCPEAGTLGDLGDAGSGMTTQPFDQLVQAFDADDPSAPGRLLVTAPYPERQFLTPRLSADGRWMAMTHQFEAPDAEGRPSVQLGLDIIEVDTGRSIDHGVDDCTIGSYGQRGLLFVDTRAVVVTKSCTDGVEVELTSLVDRDAPPIRWALPDVSSGSTVDVEVYPPSLGGADVVFVATSSDANGSGRVFLGVGDAVRELPFTDQLASFFPLPEIPSD